MISTKAMLTALMGLGVVGGVSAGSYYLLRPKASKNNDQRAMHSTPQGTDDLHTSQSPDTLTTKDNPSRSSEGGDAVTNPNLGQTSSSDSSSPESGRQEGDSVQLPSR